jgi:hypothetical protein
MTSVGDTFSVNITISDVSDLGGWEFKLYYLSSNLNGTSIIEGPFLKKGGSTYFGNISFTDNYNATHGIVWATCTLLGPSSGVDGNGTLAVIKFKARQLGTSVLSLSDTWLSDSQPIPHVALNGIVHILPHDVAITNLTLFKTIIGQGLTAKVDVDILNQGNFTETFNVTVYASITLITTQMSTLTTGDFTTITFTWDTTGFEKGNYTISAYAWPVPGETDTADNTLTNGSISVVILGDVNGDGIVEMMDFYILSKHYMHTPPDDHPIGTLLYTECFNADVNNDGTVEMMDFYILSQHYMETDP